MNVKHYLGAARVAMVAGATITATVGVAAAGTAAAATATQTSVRNGTLTVDAGSGEDDVVLRLAPGAPGTLQVDFDDDGTSDFNADRSTFTRIVVRLGSGPDAFRIDQANGTFVDEAVVVEGGSGNDVLDGGDNVEQFIGGSGSDVVDGNRGNDSADLGSGSDSFRWDPGDGSDGIDGGSGTDTLDFNGAAGPENMSLSPTSGGRSLFFRDAGSISMTMDDVEQLDLTTLGGVDTFTQDNMNATDFRRAFVDLGSDGAVDTVTVNGTGQRDLVTVAAVRGRVELTGLKVGLSISGSEVQDALQVNTLDGNDDVVVGAGVAALITATVDLGAGEP